MKSKIIAILLLASSTSAVSGSFPHETVISESITTGPMTKVTTKSYMFYDGDPDTAINAEWVTQDIVGRKQNKFNLTKKGIIYSVDLDTNRCTKTNIQAITGAIKDPEELSRQMKQQMQLKKAGSCEGAGHDGIKYTSPYGEMCFYKDIFLLWQNTMGTMTKVTKVEFDTRLPKDKITLPAGIKCVDGPDLSQGWQGMQSYSNSQPSGAPPAQQGAPQNSPQNMDDAMKMLKEMYGK